MNMRIIGVGNPLRGDDVLGHAVVDLLSAEALDPRVSLHKTGGDAADVVDLLGGCEAAIIVDAVQSDEPVGTVVILDCAQSLPQQLFLCSSHAFGVAEGIELARTLGQLPALCHIVGVVANQWEPGAPMSGSPKASLPQAVKQIMLLLQDYSGVSNA